MTQHVTYGCKLAGMIHAGIGSLVMFGLFMSSHANEPIQFRSNPYLEQPVPTLSEASNTQSQKVVIPLQARKKFCLNVRGWVVPTQHVFTVFEGLFKDDVLGEKAVETIRFWLDRGFGFALSTLIEEVYPKHYPRFVKLLKVEYKDTNAICPFRCTYRDYVELQKELSMEGQQSLMALCQPDCRNTKTFYSGYDEDFCECVVNQHSASCEGLVQDDILMIRKAVTNQNAARRDYEFRSKRNPMNNENTEAIESRKKEMVNILHGMVGR